MKLLTAIFATILLIPVSFSEGVTLQEAAKRLGEKGLTSISGAIYMGEPHILAMMDDQGITLRLTQCFREEDGTESSCKVAVFSTCREFSTIDRSEALEINNAYSVQFDARGNAHLEGIGAIGQKMCLHNRIDLQNEDVFDMADVFEWQLAMRDYFDFVEEKVARIRTKQMLGITEPSMNNLSQ